jgi:hypothetical protein
VAGGGSQYTVSMSAQQQDRAMLSDGRVQFRVHVWLHIEL